VLLAPESCSCYELETIGHLSSILLERWGLLEVLHEGDERHIHGELIRIFKEFDEEKSRELIDS
jgi:mannitol operon transcriptional antiterminator